MIDRILDLPQDHHFFIFGPRQTGKSTLLIKSFSKNTSFYVDFLKTEEFERYSANPIRFRQEVENRPENIKHVILDEIQRIPSLLNDIQTLMQGRNPPIFCLSGSSARKLKRAQANMLGGRAWMLNLYPFTARELGDLFILHKALELGTLPAIYLEQERLSAQRSLKSYVDTYIKEEIIAEALVRNIGHFYKFLPLAAEANGTIINFSNIAHDIGVSHNTVREYFQILEDTLIGFFLPAYARSSRKKLLRHPKFYFFDNGIHRALSGRAAVELRPETAEYGRVFEHFFILEIKRLATYLEKEWTFSFFRTLNNAEVDLIIETPEGEVIAIEVKASQSPANKSLRGLLSFKEVCDKAKLICACQTPRPYTNGEIEILPWQNVYAEIA
jgi:predicted AAA+ superfamily ATPase